MSKHWHSRLKFEAGLDLWRKQVLSVGKLKRETCRIDEEQRTEMLVEEKRKGGGEEVEDTEC